MKGKVTAELVAKLVRDVRADSKIGVGTCSTYDEATTDEELQEEIRDLLAEPKGYPSRVLSVLRARDRDWFRIQEERPGWF